MRLPTVNIAVLNYNGAKLLKECLPSVIKAADSYPGKCSVTVIDNKSTDTSISLLKKTFGRKIKIFYASANRMLVSYNEYINTLRDEIIVILNNDMKLRWDFILPMIKYFEYPDTFFVSPKHMDFNGKKYQGGKNRLIEKLGFISAGPKYSGFEKDIENSSFNLFTGNGAFRVSILKKLGGFDPVFLPGGMEDADLCYRGWKAGYKGFYEPASVLFHKGSASFKRFFSNTTRHINNYRNAFLFAWKNLDAFELAARIILLPVTLLAFILTGRIWHLLGFFHAFGKLSLIKRTSGGATFRKIKRIVNKKYYLPLFSGDMIDKELSLVIPAYNRKNELLALLEALLMQKFDRKKVEIIVSDDGSTDGTSIALSSLLKKHSELKYIYNKNSGPAAARNAGIMAARGRIIGFLDSDVIADKNLIRSVLKEFKNNVQALEGMTLKSGSDVPETAFTHSVENKKADRWLTCNLFILKNILHEIGGFDEVFRHPIREDTDMGFTTLENNVKSVFSSKVIVYHPVYRSDYGMFFRQAFYGIYEPLLFAKYPGYYVKYLKWFNSWFFPSYYIGYYTLPFFLFFGVLYSMPQLVFAGLLLFVISYIVSVYAVFRKKIFDFKDFIVSLLLYLFIPYIRLFWVIAGFIRLAFPR